MRAQFFCSLMGSQFQPGSRDILANLEAETPLTLIRDPFNQYDENAIQVWYEGTTLGHVARGTASSLAPLIDDGRIFTVVIDLPDTKAPLLRIFEAEEDDAGEDDAGSE